LRAEDLSAVGIEQQNSAAQAARKFFMKNGSVKAGKQRRL